MSAVRGSSLSTTALSSPTFRPYPGLRARLEESRPASSWDHIFESGHDLCRKLTGISSTPNSLIETLNLFGYRNGSIALSVCFKKGSAKNQEVKSYFEHHGIAFDFEFYYNYSDEARVIFPSQMQKLLQVISLNNEISQDFAAQCAEIITRGSCAPSPRITETSSLSSHYPGSAAFLDFREGWDDWDHTFDTFDCDYNFCRQIQLRSLNPDSLIETVQLFGYLDGSIALFVDLRRGASENPKVQSYFESYELLGNTVQTPSYFKCKLKPNDLFQIISSHNKISEKAAALFEKIISSSHSVSLLRFDISTQGFP